VYAAVEERLALLISLGEFLGMFVTGYPTQIFLPPLQLPEPLKPRSTTKREKDILRLTLWLEGFVEFVIVKVIVINMDGDVAAHDNDDDDDNDDDETMHLQQLPSLS
jgi:hypothetical protein